MITTIIIMAILLVIMFFVLISAISDVILLDRDLKQLRSEFENFANARMMNEMEINKIIKEI